MANNNIEIEPGHDEMQEANRRESAIVNIEKPEPKTLFRNYAEMVSHAKDLRKQILGKQRDSVAVPAGSKEQSAVLETMKPAEREAAMMLARIERANLANEVAIGREDDPDMPQQYQHVA